jgi:hypothetical protein
LVVLVLVATLACGKAPEPPEREVNALPLPPEAAGWAADGDPSIFDTESIYSYIDGHAEVYMAYGMKRCVSRRYAAPGTDGEIVVDLFEMASPADAYGVFSHDRDGEPVEAGQGGVFRHGWLSFWKGPWYGSVTAVDSEGATREDVVAVAAAVAEGLVETGEIPNLVHRLPADGLDPATVCYLRSPQILNAHVFVGSDDPLRMGSGAAAVVGKYDIGGQSGHLVLVQYPNEEAAEAVEAEVKEPGTSAPIRPAMTIGRQGDLVAVLVADDVGDTGEQLLLKAFGGEE